jgi:hypothetical protein
MTEVLAMCDFCREPAPAEPWAYPAKDFAAITGNIVLDFLGAWIACDTCVEYIERDDFDDLAQTHYIDEGELPIAKIIFAAFAAHRDGPRFRWR